MPKGGARTRSGPPPDPSSLTNTNGWTVLPVKGRRGAAPKWPLTKATAREMVVWRRLWSKPQALMWERLGQEDLVALYVRRFVEAEERWSVVTLSTLVRQLADELLLTTSGMLRARVRLEEENPAVAAAPSRSSAKARLTVVAGGGG